MFGFLITSSTIPAHMHALDARCAADKQTETTPPQITTTQKHAPQGFQFSFLIQS